MRITIYIVLFFVSAVFAQTPDNALILKDNNERYININASDRAINMRGYILRNEYNFIHDQYAFIHENSAVNDYVVWVNFNADSMHYRLTPSLNGISPSYSIAQDTSSLFKMSGNWVLMSSITGLQTNCTYLVKVKCIAGNYADTNNIYIRSIDADSIKYVDLDAGTNGSGSWASPYNTAQTSMSANTYYFYKRGTYEYVNSTITFADKSAIIAYGQGGRPRFAINDGDSDDHGLLIDGGTDNCIVYGLELDCRNNISRAIQVNSSATGTTNTGTLIMGCRIDSANIAIRSDESASYMKIHDNDINEAGDDGFYLELEYSEVKGNKIIGVSRTTAVGDGIQTSQTNYRNHFLHNYINMGSHYNEKQIFLSRSEYDGSDGQHGDTLLNVIEYNYLNAGTSGSTRGGIGIIGIGDTIRYNYIEGNENAWSSAAGISMLYVPEGNFINYNIINGWIQGIEFRYQSGTGHQFYNNIIRNTEDAFWSDDDNYVVTIKNNVIEHVTSKYYDLPSSSGTITIDYNLHDTVTYDGSWTVDGTNYATFGALKAGGYDVNGVMEYPDYDTVYFRPTSGGNLENAGTNVYLNKDIFEIDVSDPPELGVMELK